MRCLRSAVLMGALALASSPNLACSSDEVGASGTGRLEGGAGEAGGIGGAGGGSGGEGGSGGDGPAGCNGLDPGPAVDEVDVAGTIPDPTGGTIAEGDYVLTASEEYDDDASQPTGNVFRGALRVTGSSLELVIVENEAEVRQSGEWSTAGTTLEVRLTCPGSFSYGRAYSVVDDELWIYFQDRTGITKFERVDR